MKEFEFVTERISSNIEGSSRYPVEFEVGTPVVISNLDKIYEQIVEHSLASIKYKGESVEIKDVTYQKGQNLFFIRECALLRVGTEIGLDYYKEEEEEERLLHQYYPYFVNIANNPGLGPMIRGVSCYVPLDAWNLILFLNDIQEVPKEISWKYRAPYNYERYEINKSLHCLERTSTFQHPFSEDNKVGAHTHFVMGDDLKALLLSGRAYESEGILKDFRVNEDLFWAFTKGECNVIYIRLDEDDIEVVKNINFHLEREQLIENITRKSLNHELVGVSMTFTPYKKNGGRFILSAVVQG